MIPHETEKHREERGVTNGRQAAVADGRRDRSVRSGGDSGADAVPVVASNLKRSFGETIALQSVSVAFHRGETHAIVGENGSGKSTFAKVLSGIIPPDSGELTIADTTFDRIASPQVARRLGIAPVLQEVLTVDSLSVLDNIWLGDAGLFRHGTPEAEKRDRAAQVLAALTESPPPLDMEIERLDLAGRQVCVIARALVQYPQVLILDEATSALDVPTRERLFSMVRDLCAGGAVVIFMSHRMDEIAELGDRVTVLQSGQSIRTLDRNEADVSLLLELMSGQEAETLERRERELVDEAGGEADRSVALRVRGVRVRPKSAPVNCTIRVGEIVGIAGLEGHGQDQFVRMLARIEEPVEGTVHSLLDGEERVIDKAEELARSRIIYVPRDRKREGLFEDLSILDNFAMPTIARDGRLITSSRKRSRRLAQYIDKLRVRLGNPRAAITTLSGGNQQKIVLARWLTIEPRVLILNDPTRGVDQRTKADIYQLLIEMVAGGATVVMLSTEIEEHLRLMDRVLVFRDGTVSAELRHDQITQSRLIGAYFGEERAEDR